MTVASWEHHTVDAQRMAVEYVRREAGRVAGTALAQALYALAQLGAASLPPPLSRILKGAET